VTRELKKRQKLLLASLDKLMAVSDFARRSGRGQSYFRAFALGVEAFHLSFVEHESDFDVIADIAIRFDRLEELVACESGTPSASRRARAFTMGAELGNIRDGRQHRWTVSSENDVDLVAHGIYDMFVLVGLPYLERFSTMDAAYSVLRGDDRDSWLHSPVHSKRAIRAVGLAFLLDLHEQIDDLIEKKAELLGDDPGGVSFARFASAIRERSRAAWSGKR
jgi:hypothetical protein